MPKLAANLTFLYNEHDFLERFAAAAKSGFRAVEYLLPYAYEKQQLVDLLGAHGLVQVLHNMPVGNWAAGDRGIACQPARRGEFQASVGLTIEYAKALGCAQVNCLAGIAPPDVPKDTLMSTLVDNLKFAAAELSKHDIRLNLEPINTRDIPGFFVSRTQQALDIFAEVASPNLWLQYDIYHAQVMEGDLGPTIKANLPRIAHVQIADNPGRGEPGTGEIHHPFLFDLLDREGYRGYVGCEYKPKGKTDEGLAWARPYL
jgi:hydroxypyruvate isomerase